MKLTAADLLQLGVADAVIPEPEGGAQSDPRQVFALVDQAIKKALLETEQTGDYAARRYEKFRAMGNWRQTI